MNLIMTVGLPRSGKSTWCKKMAAERGWPIVCPDAVRWALYGRRWWAPGEKQVWAASYLMARSLFLAGHDTVLLDSTSTTREARNFWKPGDDLLWTLRYHEILTASHVCIRRAKETLQEDLIPVIERMVNNWEPLGEDDLRWAA